MEHHQPKRIINRIFPSNGKTDVCKRCGVKIHYEHLYLSGVDVGERWMEVGTSNQECE